MSEDITDSTSTIVKNSFKNVDSNGNVFLKSVRLTLNALANTLICLTMFVSLLYAWSSPMNAFHLHIILCVLGYQFFMCQGILVLSNYNGWSLYIPRRFRKQLHWMLQLIALIFVVVGSVIMICEKPAHFHSTHGSLGLCALITSLMSLLNGILATYAYKLRSYVNMFWIKYIHYVTGIGSLFLSAASLCTGFNIRSFRIWTGNDDAVPILMSITCLFTVIVSLDFLIVSRNRFCNLWI